MAMPHFVYTFTSWIGKHMDCFHFLAVMNNAAINICVQLFWQCRFLFVWGIYLRVKLLGHMVILLNYFWGIVWLFPKAATQFYIPDSTVCELKFLITLSTLTIWLFYSSHPRDVKWWYFIVLLMCISQVTNDVEDLFVVLLAICTSLLKVCSHPLPFFYCIICLLTEL